MGLRSDAGHICIKQSPLDLRIPGGFHIANGFGTVLKLRIRDSSNLRWRYFPWQTYTETLDAIRVLRS